MTELYKGKFDYHPTFQFNSDNHGIIDWTLHMEPPESIYWKTGKIKKSHIRILSQVTPEQRKELTSELYLDINPPKESPKRIKQL
jgi:hypothetical protein|tara:strand:+ start:859 stop:1113 length:255 start_codon:yes stop_codon:yes gene_type:complete